MTLVVGRQQEIYSSNDSGIQLMTATWTAGIAVNKQHGYTLQLHCLMIEILLPTAIVIQGLLVEHRTGRNSRYICLLGGSTCSLL